jgi:type IX secretion system PorP/SprF family membrane protein
MKKRSDIKSDILPGRILLCLLILILLPGNTHAQQIPRYSNYIMNGFLINPAVAGVDGMTIVNLTGRAEWVGFGKDIPTPQTYTFNIQTRLLKRRKDVRMTHSGNRLINSRDGRTGIGAALINDYNGAFERAGISGTYAYHIFLNRAQMSFGLTGSMMQLKIRDKYIEFKDPNDRMSRLTNGSIWIPDFAVGINYMTRRFQVGYAADQLFESRLAFSDASLQLSSSKVGYNRIHTLLTSFHSEFKKKPDWEYETTCLIKSNDKVSKGLKAQADALLRFVYKKSYWFGAGYRTSNDAILLLGFKHNNMYFTYAFDYGSNEMARNSYGSHEISLSLKYGTSLRRFPWVERY